MSEQKFNESVVPLTDKIVTDTSTEVGFSCKARKRKQKNEEPNVDLEWHTINLKTKKGHVR